MSDASAGPEVGPSSAPPPRPEPAPPEDQQPAGQGWRGAVLPVIRDAALVVVLSAVLALTYNALRSTGAIALVASQPYQVLVPCPEYEGEAEALEPQAFKPQARGQLVLDARSAEAFKKWHVPGARLLSFDYLEPVDEADLRSVLESSARQVVVYGDGDNPDSGQELANELSGKGIKNVYYLKGGAPALQDPGVPGANP